MDNKETGFETPEVPILCVNNCGFFGSAATMNLCSKCHKDMVLKQEHAKFAAASINSIMNGASGSNNEKAPVLSGNLEVGAVSVKPEVVLTLPAAGSLSGEVADAGPKEGPKRCTTCKKRVGLTGFACRCGNLFCGVHRYSEKHNCQFDYRTVARDAIAKANPVVKSEKLDKI